MKDFALGVLSLLAIGVYIIGLFVIMIPWFIIGDLKMWLDHA